MTTRQLGFLQIILSGSCFGLLGYFGKTAFNEGVTPGELLALRFLIAAIMLGVFLLATNQPFWKLPRSKIIGSLLLGGLGYTIFSSFYFHALTGISASLTVLLLYTYPGMVSLGNRFINNEHLGKKGLAALIISFIGMMGLVWGDMKVNDPKFLLFGVGSAIFYSVYILASGRVLQGVKPQFSTFYILVGAGVVLSLISFENLFRPLELIATQWQLFLGMAFVCSLLAMTLFQAGIQKISTSEASILSTTEPIFGILFAILLLGEQIALIQILGGALVLGAMVLLATRRPT